MHGSILPSSCEHWSAGQLNFFSDFSSWLPLIIISHEFQMSHMGNEKDTLHEVKHFPCALQADHHSLAQTASLL